MFAIQILFFLLVKVRSEYEKEILKEKNKETNFSFKFA